MPLHLAIWMLLVLAGFPASRSLSGPHLADLNVLLPPTIKNPVEYRLRGSDGCFQWSWDHHDILSVLPEYNLSSQCSMSARLISIAPYSGRKETAVYAADVHTGIVIRCMVFIDNISRIQIFHNSIKLDLDGLATLRVRAFDSEDNVFSSLVGLQFMWLLMPETDGLPHHLVHVPLKDSPLSDCGGLCGDLNIQIKLEDSGVFSDLCVVKGIEIGHELVSVHLLEPQFEHMEDKIVLTVAEAMSLDPPSPVFILIGAAVHYGLKVIRGNILQGVTLPSPYYRWFASNSSVAQVDIMMGIAHALNLGVTIVTVEDTRVAGHIQMSSLHVVIPDNICLYILPLSLSGDPVEEINAISSVAWWYIIAGHEYIIHVKVFSQGPGAHEIYITENDDVKLHYLSEYWKTFVAPDSLVVKHGWRNSRILKATSPGLGKLMASLTYSSGYPEKKEVVQEVMVCEQVKLSTGSNGSASQSILLPWVPSVYQEVELKATGGCAKAGSDYKWFSSDKATVSVSATGVIQAMKPGTATVKVVSIFDSVNYDEVSVEVSIPSSMVMLQNFPVETAVGSLLQAAVTMKSSNGAYFYKCDAFNSFIQWKVGSESFVIVNGTGETSYFDKVETIESSMPVFGPACAWTYLYASNAGQAMLHATVSKEYQQYGPFLLKACSCIAAYFPLRVHQAGHGNQFGGYWYDLDQEEAHVNLENLVNLYLVPGSQMDVLLLGGPEQWDQGVEHIKTVEILDEKHAYIKDTDIVHEVSMSHRSLYRVFCRTVGTFKLVFKRGNLVGDDHPIPSVAEAELSLSCSLPSSIVLIADEPVNAQDIVWMEDQIDRGPGQIRVTPITVANGRTIRIAAVGISNSGKAFANSSSLCLSWELSSCHGLAHWHSDYNFERSKSSWEKFLVLQNESGLCIVRATVTGFHDTMTGHHSALSFENLKDLTDAVRLQLVSTLRVEPDFQLLFFSPNTKVNMSITGGSCFLNAVANDSQIVEIVQPPTGLQCSQLILVPKGLGTALVTVYDIGLTPPLAASSLVRVADIDWIKINSQAEISLMEGSLQSIDLLVGVSDGLIFDSSQYVNMNIYVHIEDHIVDIEDGDDFSSSGGGYINEPNFVIMARQIGVTTLYVSARQQSGHEILSQPIKVEIYAPPVIHPDNIFLVPGASYVLTAKGGPTVGVYLEYTSIDDGITKVDKAFGLLSAISPGNTVLTFQAMEHFDGVKYGVKFAGSNESNEFEFTSNTDMKDFGFINVLYGRSAGRTIVAISFSCDFISESFSQSRSYSASVSLGVVSDLPLALGVPMTWILPPHYSSSSLLPSSSELASQLETHSRKGTVTYSLLRDCGGNKEELHKDAIVIDGDRIKTTDTNNLACIQAKDHTTGQIAVAACVRVTEVAQIRITTTEHRFHTINLAVGAELELPINYCDVLGSPFQEANNVILLDADTNYPNIVLIDDVHDGYIRIKGARHGQALLRISMHGNLRKSDYMLISVGAHLYPQNPVLCLGSTLNFIIEGLNDEVFGPWLSANESVIYVETQSGKAHAVGEGTTQVLFEGSNLKLQTAVTVIKGSIISVDAPKEALTNVPFPLKGYYFSVKFSDAYENKSKAAGNDKEVLYDCRVDPPYIGYAKPWRDLDSGNSYCLFFPYSPEHLVHSIPRSKDMRPDIYVSLNAVLREANHVSGSASALFIGGFSILEMDKLNFTPDHNKSIITIVGNTDVEIFWHNRDMIMITLIHKEDFGVGSRAQFEVKVLGSKRFNDTVIMMLPANGQKVVLDVNYEPGQRDAPATSVNTTLWAGVLGCLALLILTVAIFICILDRPDRSQPSIPPATPSFTSPATANSGSSAISNERSPRTPQPFVDYVRRTIDETPHYRREGRRRFNPQNTF
ncbi:nuclear pore complex protein GP210 isoform X2 [Malania oleifera]|uniref:nuclear pore complex protein GP210 isoform X2 n=1 Tax=Malania oleifera TaxID=397392 RepID=UPI0025AE1959|nr:nuclear pore complex protein GP210 isoform X2 [Malania oleifera]